jgi:hypothetical protein
MCDNCIRFDVKTGETFRPKVVDALRRLIGTGIDFKHPTIQLMLDLARESTSYADDWAIIDEISLWECRVIKVSD